MDLRINLAVTYRRYVNGTLYVAHEAETLL